MRLKDCAIKAAWPVRFAEQDSNEEFYGLDRWGWFYRSLPIKDA